VKSIEIAFIRPHQKARNTAFPRNAGNAEGGDVVGRLSAVGEGPWQMSSKHKHLWNKVVRSNIKFVVPHSVFLYNSGTETAKCNLPMESRMASLTVFLGKSHPILVGPYRRWPVGRNFVLKLQENDEYRFL
jgi:hypothetical protein